MNPQPSWMELSSYYSEEYPPYDPLHGVENGFQNVIRQARESGRYRDVSIRPGMRILDVGCGAGSFLHVARELGASVMGVEPSPVAAERARQFGIEVFTGTLESYIAQRGQTTALT